MRQRAYVKISVKREVCGVRVALVADRMAKFKFQHQLISNKVE